MHLSVPQYGLSLRQFAIKMTSLLKSKIISIMKFNKCKQQSTVGSMVEQSHIRLLIINHSFKITRPHRDVFVNNTAFRLIICHH